jgi:FkbH-like protein
MSALTDFLRTVVVFQDLDDRALQTLASLLVTKKFKAGQIIFREQDGADALYVVQRGQVIVSKHVIGDVDHVLTGHPDMLLRDDDFVAKKVNWLDKATNLRALSQELNVGLDSFVFVDDSGFELGLINQAMPEIALVQVPEQLSEYPVLMRRTRQLFFSLSRSKEDARKTEMYKDEGARQRAALQFSSVDDYLRSLGLRITVSWNDKVPVERAAQLTQKTNQFNLTTRRYTEIDISAFLNDGMHLVASIDVSDRYGDYGVTGLAIVECDLQMRKARLDTFLLSCRVLGRNLERAFFDHLVDVMRDKGIDTMQSDYVRTLKNGQVSALMESFGFSMASEDENTKRYFITLNEYHTNRIDYIEVTTNAC